MPFEPNDNTAPTRSRCRIVTRCHPLLLATIVALGCGAEAPPQSTPGASTEAPSSTRPGPPFDGVTASGQYRVRARPAETPIPLHRMHDWVVGIELLGEASEVPSSVRFDGGMPSHGHGFVTRPRVTRNLGGGEFLVEGVKFHMPGDWVVSVVVQTQGGSEKVTWPLAIEP